MSGSDSRRGSCRRPAPASCSATPGTADRAPAARARSSSSLEGSPTDRFADLLGPQVAALYPATVDPPTPRNDCAAADLAAAVEAPDRRRAGPATGPAADRLPRPAPGGHPPGHGDGWSAGRAAPDRPDRSGHGPTIVRLSGAARRASRGRAWAVRVPAEAASVARCCPATRPVARPGAGSRPGSRIGPGSTHSSSPTCCRGRRASCSSVMDGPSSGRGGDASRSTCRWRHPDLAGGRREAGRGAPRGAATVALEAGAVLLVFPEVGATAPPAGRDRSGRASRTWRCAAARRSCRSLSVARTSSTAAGGSSSGPAIGHLAGARRGRRGHAPSNAMVVRRATDRPPDRCGPPRAGPPRTSRPSTGSPDRRPGIVEALGLADDRLALTATWILGHHALRRLHPRAHRWHAARPPVAGHRGTSARSTGNRWFSRSSRP